MKFTRIEPIEYSPSRRWFVDELGFELVKDMYTNYVTGINKWDQFKYYEVKEVWFDFGGMMRMNTPKVSEMIDNVKFELHVTHIAILLEALKSPRQSNDNHWQCGTQFNSYCFSYETRDKLVELFTKKFSIYEEMIEGFDKEMDESLKKLAPHVISTKKYHKDKNEK